MRLLRGVQDESSLRPVVLMQGHAWMQGWNKKWDEWVEAPGLAKWSPTLVRPDQMLNGKAKGGGGPSGKKRRLDELNDDALEPVAAHSHQVNDAHDESTPQ